MAVVHLSAANEQAFNNSAHCELKIFLWVQSAKVSPLTRLGLFFLATGVTGLEAARITKGSPQTTLAQKRRAVSSEP